MKSILVTGANGFIGKALVQQLLASGVGVHVALRSPETRSVFPLAVPVHVVGNIGPDTDWSLALSGVDTVIHLAARVHVMKEKANDPLAAFRNVNVFGTLNLAESATYAGVKRFVYLSSIKVNGERTEATAFSEKDVPAPEDAYGRSKWEAEEQLKRLADKLDLVILRPPLVYGPGVRANFLRLMKLAVSGLPLPFGAIENRRSMIYLGNLVDALITSAQHPSAPGKTFLIADGKDFSTRELFAHLARLSGAKARLLPVAPFLLRALAKATGRSMEVSRLTDSLQVNAAQIHHDLNWQPPFDVMQGLAQTVAWYQQKKISNKR